MANIQPGIMRMKPLMNLNLRHYGLTNLPDYFDPCKPPKFADRRSWYKPSGGMWFVPYKPFVFDPWFIWCLNHPEDGKIAEPSNRVDTKFDVELADKLQHPRIIVVDTNDNHDWLVNKFPLPWFKFQIGMRAYLPYVNWFRVVETYLLDGVYFTENFVKNTPYGWSVDVESMVIFNRKVVV